MRLVYVDEAGLSNPEQEPFLVVVGAVVHGDSALNGIEANLRRIREKHIPERFGDDFVFHAFELFGGKGKHFTREKPDFIGPIEWPLSRRLAIADEILSIPKKFSLPIAMGFVKRNEFSKDFAAKDFGTDDETVAAHVLAFTSCSFFIEQWMRLNASNENCLLVVEDNDRARSLLRGMHQWHQSAEAREVFKDLGREFFPFRKIREDPLFQKKRSSSGLIIADFCAYVMKRILMGDERYRSPFGLFVKNIISFEDSQNPFFLAAQSSET